PPPTPSPLTPLLSAYGSAGINLLPPSPGAPSALDPAHLPLPLTPHKLLLTHHELLLTHRKLAPARAQAYTQKWEAEQWMRQTQQVKTPSHSCME
ncbi:unnamed protein product, partial [Closterium sp. Yama58-4]